MLPGLGVGPEMGPGPEIGPVVESDSTPAVTGNWLGLPAATGTDTVAHTVGILHTQTAAKYGEVAEAGAVSGLRPSAVVPVVVLAVVAVLL